MTVVKKLGRYDIVRTLGKGAMGLVYEGKDTVLQRRVAIKTIIVENLDSKSAEEYESRFRTEALAAARLLHPNIVPVFDFGRHDDIAFLVMQFIEGDDLKHHIDRGERFTPQQSVAMILDLLSALDQAHENNIVHRDIKPANMLIEKGRVKLTDFGVARIQDPDSANKTQVGAGGIGTPRYMSPEQAQGQRVDARSDLFSAGIVLYELLAGVRPFEGDNPFAIIHQIVSSVPPPPTYHNPRLPKAMDAVVAKALAKNRDERFSSAREFAVALKAAAQKVGAAGATGGGTQGGATGSGTGAGTSAGRTSATSPTVSTRPASEDGEATRLPGQGPSSTSGTGTGGVPVVERSQVSQDQTVLGPATRTAGRAATQPAPADAVARAAEQAAAVQARAATTSKEVERLEGEKQFFAAKAEAEAKERLRLEEEARKAREAAEEAAKALANQPKKSKVLPVAIAGVLLVAAAGATYQFTSRNAEQQTAQAVESAKAAAAAEAAQQVAALTARTTAQEQARLAEEAKRKAEEAKKQAEADAKKALPEDPKLRAEAEAKRKAEADAKAKLDAEGRAKFEAETRARLEAEMRTRAEAEARARAQAAPAPSAPAQAAAPAQPAQPAPQQVARVTLSPSQLLAQAQQAEQAGQAAEAIRAYRQAAAAGSGAAAKRLGELYSKGGQGVERDSQQAAFYNNRARSLGESVQEGAGPCALKAGTTC